MKLTLVCLSVSLSKSETEQPFLSQIRSKKKGPNSTLVIIIKILFYLFIDSNDKIKIIISIIMLLFITIISFCDKCNVWDNKLTTLIKLLFHYKII